MHPDIRSHGTDKVIHLLWSWGLNNESWSFELGQLVGLRTANKMTGTLAAGQRTVYNKLDQFSVVWETKVWDCFLLGSSKKYTEALGSVRNRTSWKTQTKHICFHNSREKNVPDNQVFPSLILLFARQTFSYFLTLLCGVARCCGEQTLSRHNLAGLYFYISLLVCT